MRQGTAILQSCTVVPVSVKVEEESCVTVRVEETPEPISFPAIKAEPDEVSYLPVCPLLDTCHQYP
jgi:hypothetical protein